MGAPVPVLLPGGHRWRYLRLPDHRGAPLSTGPPAIKLAKPVVGMARGESGGYYLAGSDGGVFSSPHSDGPAVPSAPPASIVLNKPIVGMSG